MLQSAGAREVRGSVLVLLVAIPLLAMAGWFVHQTVANATVRQQQIRAARVTRTRLVREQLDQETGVRGFTSTHDPVYLKSYYDGQETFANDVVLVRMQLGALPLNDVLALIEEETAINTTWNREVVVALLRSRPFTPEANALQLRGKLLIDEFRATDAKVSALLDAESAAIDEVSQRAVNLTLLFDILVVVVVLAISAVFGSGQARAARRAFESRLQYENEKRITGALQEAFLQKKLPEAATVGLHATYVPASTDVNVGGDWYDAFELPDGRILFSIGDVAGHGLEAAVVMNRTRQAIVSAALQEANPASVLERVNESVLLQEDRMVTAICGYIDPASAEVVYATAGHPPPIMVAATGEATLLPYSGVPLGIVRDVHYETVTTQAVPGSLMVLYTDGLLEYDRDVIVGERRLLAAAPLSIRDSNPAVAIHKNVFADGKSPADDVALLTISFREPGANGGMKPLLDSLQASR